MTSLEFDGSIKMLKETLCDAQALAVFLQLNASIPHYVDTLQKLINECERHRPVGPDGKHGDRHTATCGCEDKGHGPWCEMKDIDGNPALVIFGICPSCKTFIENEAMDKMGVAKRMPNLVVTATIENVKLTKNE